MDEEQVVPAQDDALITLREWATLDSAPALHRLLAEIDGSGHPTALPLSFSGVKVLGNVVTGDATVNFFLGKETTGSFWLLLFVPEDDTGTLLPPPHGDRTDGTAILFASATSVLSPGKPTSDRRRGYGLQPPKVLAYPAGVLVAARCDLYGGYTMLGSLGFQVTLGLQP
ncbi:hypothetical protein P3T27_005994 [Kitasatospora sp. MAA19]|uniref:hypothetical protein n=1 Tax=unclassified Kitasatospora TaxID=2633591 RepID=UPI00247709BC|nr:hypothetical protein [Kitasatospora sp. MAA19]MDH6709248.1 hypothetical protein [Kitasatospora sp. MAA19]